MNNDKNITRLGRITTGFADKAEEIITAEGQNFLSVFLKDVASWLIGEYNNWKRSISNKSKLEDLQRYIESSDRATQIGMDKKEIAVMWAMRKLGYSQEETQNVLDMANKAYGKKEEH